MLDYLIPRVGWNYEVRNGKKVYSTEDLCLGNFYGLFWFNLRWRSAEDGRTPMLSVLLTWRGKVVVDRYVIKPKN